MIVSDSAFLCGYFSASGAPANDLGWSQIKRTPEEEDLLRNFFFPEFVDFNTKHVQRYELAIDQKVRIKLRSGKELPFEAKRAILWMMPFSLAIFAIETSFVEQDIDDVTESLATLRNCERYGESLADFVASAISPIDKTYRAFKNEAPSATDNYSHLVENGNKFKIFQIITSADCPEDSAQRDRLLYCAGTWSKYEHEEPFSVDARYYEKVLKDFRLGVFSSWTALTLFDTVTFLTKDISDGIRITWVESYFGMIYIYELYKKCFLYKQNLLFRTEAKDPVILQKEIKDFERKYSFTSISYNFLPIEVDLSMASGLDSKSEEEALRELIAEEVAAREEESSSKRDKFLLFLTCLASFSAVWDISCLLDELINYERAFSAPNWGYRLFSALLLLLIAMFAMGLRKKRQ